MYQKHTQTINDFWNPQSMIETAKPLLALYSISLACGMKVPIAICHSTPSNGKTMIYNGTMIPATRDVRRALQTRLKRFSAILTSPVTCFCFNIFSALQPIYRYEFMAPSKRPLTKWKEGRGSCVVAAKAFAVMIEWCNDVMVLIQHITITYYYVHLYKWNEWYCVMTYILSIMQ